MPYPFDEDWRPDESWRNGYDEWKTTELDYREEDRDPRWPIQTGRRERPWCTLCNEPIADEDLALHMHVLHGWPLEETPE